MSLNDKVIEIPLEPGNSHKIVTLSGEQGPNQVVFTLKYDGKSKGIVSVILNMFEVQWFMPHIFFISQLNRSLVKLIFFFEQLF